ncbi:hypothetical protein C100_04320 [Sphingobium sp. C100]|uniref:FecR family protein n=1 Tax=Sphingobium sp. C100 TaxID=1207055 RepID=UPI0003D5EA83|nr:FecR domain-containing protein [Sphingobium sp. C100]ETI65020.1 hypothetical protein C100_04320 [Sphingobium sp. C100]
MTASPAHDPDRDRIDEEASTWVVLASERELTREEQRKLDTWRAADARHEAAWQDFSRTWGDIPQMRNLADLVPLHKIAANDRLDNPRPQRWRLPKAAWGAVAAVLIAMLAIPTLLWQSQPEQYATEIAQTRLIALPDGTQVTLGPKSSLALKFSDGDRRVALTGGEAFFEVVHDRSRPFLVEAGSSLIRVVGTKFDVNFTDQTVRVSVLQGLVEVKDSSSSATGRPETQMLRAGQRTEILLAKLEAPKVEAVKAPAIVALPAQAPGAWREGRLVYENMRLADLVADVNRYYAPGVTMADPSIGDMRVTAAFKASEIPAFMSALGGVVPVRATEATDGAFRLERADN